MKRQKAKVLPSFADKDNSSSEQDYITTPLIVTYDTSDVGGGDSKHKSGAVHAGPTQLYTKSLRE